MINGKVPLDHRLTTDFVKPICSLFLVSIRTEYIYIYQAGVQLQLGRPLRILRREQSRRHDRCPEHDNLNRGGAPDKKRISFHKSFIGVGVRWVQTACARTRAVSYISMSEQGAGSFAPSNRSLFPTTIFRISAGESNSRAVVISREGNSL